MLLNLQLIQIDEYHMVYLYIMHSIYTITMLCNTYNDKHPAPTVDITIVNIDPWIEPALQPLPMLQPLSSHLVVVILDNDNNETKLNIAETEMVSFKSFVY